MPGDLTRGHEYADTGTGADVNAANLHAHVEDAVINANAVTTVKILDGAVAEAKLAALAVTNGKLGPDAVDGDKLADDAVSGEHIADGVITLNHFHGSARPVTYDFGPASATSSGLSGLVPAPKAGEQEYFLRGDGWYSFTDQATPLVDAAVLASPSITFHNNLQFR